MFVVRVKSSKIISPMGEGVLAMFAYEDVRAMFLRLKFHLKAIFLGLKFANMNFPYFFFFWRGGGGGGEEFSAVTIFSHFSYVIPQK